MRDTEPAWAFFEGCVQGVLVVLGAIVYLIVTITLIVYVSAWLFIPMFIFLCFILTYMRYGKQWFIDQWNK